MRISVDELLEKTLISPSYFKKILSKCSINNKIYLDEFDLKKIYEIMPVKTYKSKKLLEKIKTVLVRNNHESFI